MKRRDEVTVGILITVAVIVVVLGTLWLVRGGLKSGYPLYTRFAWGQNLKQGQPVLLAGVTVGYVGDVNFRREGYLDVMIRVEDQYTVPKGSTASVKAVGIFGDVAVALTPPNPVPATNYVEGDTIPPGPSAVDIGQIMGRVDSIGTSVSLIMKALQTEVIEAGTLKDLHRVVASAATVSAQLTAVLAEQNRNVTRTMDAFRASAERIGGAVDSAQISASLTNARMATENANRLVAHVDSTNAEIQRLLVTARTGNGTVGKFMQDSTLYSDTHRLLFTLDSLVADIKANPKKYINVCVFHC